jgi:polysaccharide export outer membrane protein
VQQVDLSGLSGFSTSSELIDCGDVLEVMVAAAGANFGSITAPVRVDKDGTAQVPLVGRVPLAGLEMDEAEQRIAAEAVHRGVFTNPLVSVTMKRQRVNRVLVMGGGVKEPGIKEMPRGNSSLLWAITAAGGLSEQAGPEVEIRRPPRRAGSPGLPDGPGGPQRLAGSPGNRLASFESGQSFPATGQIIQVNLMKVAMEGQRSYYVGDGDVVYVPKLAPEPVHVMGLVRDPGEIELPPNRNVTMLAAISQAGGVTTEVADKVLVIRRVPGLRQPIVIEASIEKAKKDGISDIPLAPGDLVSVETTPLTLAVDAIRTFFRVGFSSALPLF